ncbi:MAG: flagellar biosynthesis regulator FlaF [Caulobacterales bacterium]|nr:flagellar biosynthesis regulator FlaF [Caulobacterales bacterium]
MGLQAYQQTAQRTESPRALEYRLFGQVTRALIAASQSDPKDFGTRIDALGWNRQMWATLATTCSDPGNGLPVAMRASIISLSLFVSRHTSEVMKGDEDFETLIDINKMIMQGLGGAGTEAVPA